MDPQGSEIINADQAYCPIQLIDGDGNWKEAELKSLTNKAKLAECGISYAVVSIIGPQSGGKSTLLNHLFHTGFKEMDSSQERTRTTKGIWMAKANCVGIKPCTLVMDIEGTDGRERGEDTVFERQSALFALAVSDIVLINMWRNDVNREHAANKPLLKTVFQIMLKLFPPRNVDPPRKTLLFVIRDKGTKATMGTIKSQVNRDIQTIWNSVLKPEAHRETSLSEVFRVEVEALSSFDLEEAKFIEQVDNLRQRYFSDSVAPDGVAADRRGDASDFFSRVKEIWTCIKADPNLHQPALKVLLATIRCDEIVEQKFSSFKADVDWCKLKDDVNYRQVPDFRAKLGSILDKYLSKYIRANCDHL